MTRQVYVDGRYWPYAQARVHAEDRGFQFADAVYEVCEVHGGALVDEERHLERLERSLGELQIACPMSRAALGLVMREVVRRNGVKNGVLYLQVSRGAARRDFLFPFPAKRPTVVCLARSIDPARVAAVAEKGIAVKTTPDIRWSRRDIKTTMLLPSCLAKQAAFADGAREAWFVDEAGYVTEGASSNAWIVTLEGALITRPIDDHAILPGVTRATLMDLIGVEKLTLKERPFTLAEALAAREAFITAASNTVMPVVSIDGSSIGGGFPGPVVRRLRERFHDVATRSSRRILYQN